MKGRRRNIAVNNKIDYDKLAEAMVKANAKQQEMYSTSREWMKYILIPIFWGIAIISGILAIGLFVSLCKQMTTLGNGTIAEDLIILFEFFITFFAIGFCTLSIVAAKEIEKENDRTYVASMFSNIVATAALIVAIIALLKGVR